MASQWPRVARPEPAMGALAAGRNLLLVTVDCLRRDRLSGYGYERPTTPFLDRLLERSLHCTSAHSTSSWTCPSVASLLTGLYPHRHGGGIVPGDPKNLSKRSLPTSLPPEVPSLADILAARGYATAAVGAVWNAHLSIPGRFGHMDMIEKRAPRLIRQTVRWIRSQDRPFFLWLHLGDAHEPLDVPRRMWNLFGDVPRIRRIRQWDYTRSNAPVESEEFRRYRDGRIRLYDVAVRASDDAIGELWSALQSMGLLESTIFAVTSDHWEEFWEHRYEEMAGFSDPRDIYGTGHGHNLFQVHLLVPLVITGPGVPSVVIDGNVTLADVAPTFLQALDADLPHTDGRSLLEPLPVRPIISEGIAYGHEKKSVVLGDLKLLSSPGDGYERVFRLGPNRREATSIDDRSSLDALRHHLPGEPARLGQLVEATPEIEAHLRSLGYIE